MGGAGGMGLPRNTAGLQGATEPLAAGEPGCLFHSLSLGKRHLDGRQYPATTAGLIRE